MTQTGSGRLRTARAEDGTQLLRLWALFSDDGDTTPEQPWKDHAREWFKRYADDHRNARFPAIEVDGKLVATAIGTLEIGVPNPQCARGRTVRLANVITLPEHRDAAEPRLTRIWGDTASSRLRRSTGRDAGAGRASRPVPR